MTIISIGYGRTLFREDDAERARLLACAKAAGAVHHIVFSKKEHALESEVIDDALFLYPTNSQSRIGMLFDALRIGRGLGAQFPDATITSQDPLAAGLVGYLLARKMRRPLVVQEHGDIFSGNYWRSEAVSHTLWYMLAQFIIRRADRVRVVSKRVAAHVAALGVEGERIRTLAVFSDLASMQQREIGESVRARHEGASLLVLSVARFVPQKNLILLFRAFKKLHEVQPGAKLILVGRGPLEMTLRSEVAILGLAGVALIEPWAEDVASLMKTADIYALSSNYEGWARVLPEAMACGLPAVSTDVGCAGEVFLPDRHGLVVPVGDEQAFADALIRLASDIAMRRTCGEQGMKDSAAHLDTLESYAQRWSEIYQGL